VIPLADVNTVCQGQFPLVYGSSASLGFEPRKTSSRGFDVVQAT